MTGNLDDLLQVLARQRLADKLGSVGGVTFQFLLGHLRLLVDGEVHKGTVLFSELFTAFDYSLVDPLLAQVFLLLLDGNGFRLWRFWRLTHQHNLSGLQRVCLDYGREVTIDST